MKKTKFKILLAVTLAAISTACVNDLNVTPIDPNLTTGNVVYTDLQSYKQGLAKLYASFMVTGQQGPSGQPDIAGINEDFSGYLRSYWNLQELPTDEAVMAWNDRTIKDFHWHTWSASDVFISAMYSRIMFTVTLCNEYIRLTSENSDPEIQRFNAEAKFLRALAYWHGLDLFGNMPFVTEEHKVGAFLPEQILRPDLYNYIEEELRNLEDKLGEPRFEYARADKGALWMLQAKLYLNAPVYIGEDRNTECLTALNKVLAASYDIADTYRNNFVADNHVSPEIILPFTSHGEFTKTDGGTTYLIHAAVGGDMSPGDFGIGTGWAGLRTTSALVDKFNAGDNRAMFFTEGQSLEIDDINQFTQGYAITKWTNLTSDNELPVPNADAVYVYTDYPMFRLADAYLMYAEAVLRGGQGGDATTALGYVNELRERAFGDASANISSAQLTLDFILDERARELYWEGHRRTDLIRYGKFTGGEYVWPWKGNVKDGTATPSYRNLYPIPSNDLGANPNLEQNDDY